jgi:esterase FrsA
VEPVLDKGFFRSSGYFLLFLLLIGFSSGALFAAAKRRDAAQAGSNAAVRLPGYPAAWRGSRMLPEIKAEALSRAKQKRYPVAGLSVQDLETAFASIHSLGKDEWGAAFMAVGDRYMDEAKQVEKSNPAEANKDYLEAWRIYSFGRWPVSWSSGRRRCYEKSLTAFFDYAHSLNPPLQIIRIPYAGSQIIAYMRLPEDRHGPVPIVIAISGLDSRKEGTIQEFAPLLSHGIGILAVDGPGTGQAPVKFGPTADRMFSRIIDYLEAQPEIDKSRIAVYGQSLGSYWATKLAFTEHKRLCFVIAQSPGADYVFQKSWVLNHLVGNREYLYGLAPALMHVMAGNVQTLSQFETAWAANSLVTQHLIGTASAPMLIIAGAKDTLIPVADTALLLESGQSPKYAWVNPVGRHMGRQYDGEWPQERIQREVVMPWLIRQLQPAPASASR